jgi:Kelch motif/Galactose oxidase, central domain
MGSMKIRLDRVWLSAAVLVLCGCSSGRSEDSGAGRPAVAAPRVLEESSVGEIRLRALVEAHRYREASLPVIRPGNAERYVTDGKSVRPVLFADRARGVARPAAVELPLSAASGVRVEDQRSGTRIAFAPAGIAPAPIEIADGLAIYLDAFGPGFDWVLRATAEGIEDFVVLPQRPPHESLEYSVDVSAVAGLRLVENVLELLDASGDPRLRLAHASVVDAEGRAHAAEVSVDGCAADRDPRVPWGRAVVSPGNTHCKVRLDWADRGVKYPAIVDPTWQTTQNMASARREHAAVSVGSSAQVVVAGGVDSTGAYVKTAEVFSYASGSFAATSSMTTGRADAASTRLANGDGMVSGGRLSYNGGDVYGFSQNYSVTSGTWSSAVFHSGRAFHTVTLLPNGKVLAAGGEDTSGTYTSSAYLYDAALNAWSPTSSMTAPRVFHTATLTGSVVFVAGGDGSLAVSTERYNIASGTWSAAANRLSTRQNFSAAALPNGKVLAVGGTFNGTALKTAETYDPTTNTWSAGPDMPNAHSGAGIAVLAGGGILVAGGGTGTSSSNTDTALAEIFDTSTSTWKTGGSMSHDRSAFTLTVMTNGRVLAAGGRDVGGPFAQSSAEIFTLLSQGSACTTSAECETAQCVDGVCCNTACAGTCMACSNAKTAQPNGTCAPVKIATDPDNECKDDGSPSCQKNGLCNGAGACQNYPTSSGCTPNPCTSGTQCTSGFCADGICCDSSCSGTCVACTAAKKGGGVSGVCGYITDGADPDSECGTIGSGTCMADSVCNGSGGCRSSKLGVECQSASCQSTTTQVNPWTCTDVGVCTTNGNSDCNPYKCDQAGANKCRISCTTSNDCQAPFICVGGSCGTGKVKGSACTLGSECQSGNCVDGVCCDSGCSNLCNACTAAKKGQGLDGDCGPIKSGIDPDNECTDGGAVSCSTDGFCNGSGACRLYASGTPCGSPVCVGNSLADKACDGAGACKTQAASQDCTPYLCSGGSCPSTCAGDAQCAIGNYCTQGQCQQTKADGAQCSAANECANAHCVDGVCCDLACSGTCQACSSAKKGAGADGDCGPIAKGADPDNECAQQPVSTCGFDGSCNGQGACGYYASGTSCGSSSCLNNKVSGSFCDGLGACNVNPSGVACDPYKCITDSCANPCQGDTDCVPPNICAQGSCVPKLGNGVSCGQATQCTSGNCVEGVCCDLACGGLCQSCLASKKGVGQDGECGSIAAGTDPESECPKDPQATCLKTGSCDGAGNCAFYQSGVSCGDSVCVGNVAKGKICDGQGSCTTDASGSDCAPFKCVATGCLASCVDDNDCLQSAYCAAGVCLPKAADGTACTVANGCLSGYCADGYCCNAECKGQCEACAELGSEGICKAVSGDPRPGRAVCAGTTKECKGTCDGGDTTTCKYPDNATTCSDAACVSGDVSQPASTCDGAGQCAPSVAKNCLPFACDATSGVCKAKCVTDGDCSQGAKCDSVSGLCAVTAGQCKDSQTVELPNGQAESCSPYKCVSGACQQQCTADSDCVSGYVCSAPVCVKTDGGAGGAGAAGGSPAEPGDSGGCGCRLGAAPRPLGYAWLLLALAFARRRRGARA